MWPHPARRASRHRLGFGWHGSCPYQRSRPHPWSAHPSLVAPMTTDSRQSRGTHLKLFVAGKSARSLRAVENVQRIVAEALCDACEVEVIDVLRSPERAERERILATPTLLKESPPPRRRITGDLSDIEQVVRILEPATGAEQWLPFRTRGGPS